MFVTKVTKLLNIQHPIVCGGLTGVGTDEFCAAVSNAGCLGVMTAHNAVTPENLLKCI